MELSVCFGEIFLAGTWKTEPVKMSSLNLTGDLKSDEFIVHMSFVYLAYPYYAYKIERGHLSPNLLNSGQV